MAQSRVAAQGTLFSTTYNSLCNDTICTKDHASEEDQIGNTPPDGDSVRILNLPDDAAADS